jgi:hypothetical protein
MCSGAGRRDRDPREDRSCGCLVVILRSVSPGYRVAPRPSRTTLSLRDGAVSRDAGFKQGGASRVTLWLTGEHQSAEIEQHDCYRVGAARHGSSTRAQLTPTR